MAVFDEGKDRETVRTEALCDEKCEVVLLRVEER